MDRRAERQSAPIVWVLLGGATVAFHLGLIFYGLVPNLVSRPVHMALLLPWIFVFAAQTKGARVSGMILAALGIVACAWIALQHDALRNQFGFLETDFQIALAVMLLVIAMEGARRMIGWPLPIVALLALLYGLYGQHLPGQFGHAGVPLRSFLGTLVITEGGLWGKLTGVSVNVVAIFVILGAILNAGEAGQGFMNVASAAAGRLKGGAAKVSVLSSALFGSISGSASANVASTGAITLPAMTKLGYPKRLAAGVEAVASSGGQIMPPLMGAGAFIMVELTGVPYTQIMAAALLPALLYFATVWIGIDAFASRFDLKAIPVDERPKARDVIITSLYFAVPFTILLAAIFAVGYTPQFAACLAIFAAFALLFVNRETGVDLGVGTVRVAHAMMAAGKQVAMIGSIIICASIIIGVLGITGLGVKITSLIVGASSGLLWPALLLTALACLLLGMEVPTTAAYVICVSVAGPALIALGLEPLQAHLFVFWFALLSTITPPVCGAVFIAAGMIEENWLKVAATAMMLGVGLYIIPLAMIANPTLLELSTTPLVSVLTAGQVGLGLALLSLGLIASLAPAKRLALLVGGFMVVFVRVLF
ncbi:MAG: TRAP transporter fused permease subunit [Pseudomonadota bacterium]